MNPVWAIGTVTVLYDCLKPTEASRKLECIYHDQGKWTPRHCFHLKWVQGQRSTVINTPRSFGTSCGTATVHLHSTGGKILGSDRSHPGTAKTTFAPSEYSCDWSHAVSAAEGILSYNSFMHNSFQNFQKVENTTKADEEGRAQKCKSKGNRTINEYLSDCTIARVPRKNSLKTMWCTSRSFWTCAPVSSQDQNGVLWQLRLFKPCLQFSPYSLFPQTSKEILFT